MRKTIFYSILFLFSILCYNTAKAQTYALNNGFTFNETITTCSGTFYDSNVGGNYAPFESYIVTFRSGNIGKVMQMNFTQMAVGAGDTLFVYDGLGTNNAVLDTFTNVIFNGEFVITVSDTSNSGALTFKFTSNASIQALGWQATIKCAFKCQKIQGNIITTPPKDANGYTNMCISPSGVLQLEADVLFPQNGLTYDQSNATSTFHWFFGDGKDTIGTNLTMLSHNYINQGGYNIKLVVKDSNGCVNSLPINVKLRTSINPIFNISAVTSMCLNDTIKLTPFAVGSPSSGGFVLQQQGAFLQLPVSSDSLFLPDGTGVTYTSNLFVDQFASGQTLTDINLLKGIFLNLEHSYLGDIDIAITAPNGVKVFLKSGSGSQDCFLGEPVDGNLTGGGADNPALNNVRGDGYDYWFNTTPQYGTMLQEANAHIYSYVDNAGRNVINHKYLPSGSYTSANNLNALVGTPLNGTWTLQIKDWQAIDNGFLFGWYLKLDPSLYPSVETYNVPIVSQNWITPASGILSVNGTVATISPNLVQQYNFVYRAVDSFGCSLDTTIIIHAKTAPVKPMLGGDIAFCNGQTSLNLTVSNPDNTGVYSWSNGNNGVTSISVSTPNTYIVTATNTTGCFSKDTIVVNPVEMVQVQLGIDTFYCATKPNLLKPIVSNNVINYLWNNATTKDTLRINSVGTYYVTGTTANGCSITDTIVVTDNPINSFVFPADNIICDQSNYLVTLTPPANTNILWNDGFTGFVRSVSGINTYIITANNIGCLKQGSFTVNTKPLPIINLGLDETICTTKTKLLAVKYSGASYLWNDNSTDSSLLVKTPNTYWVEASFNGCNYRDSIEIKYVKCECLTTLPNAFSPNGDGINDFFFPKMECIPIGYLLTVFNRYGQPVFETKDYQLRWNGTSNGKSLPVGTYYYILTYVNDGLKIPERFTGSVTIIR